MAIAQVEPLLTTRSVRGPFDYRLPEEMSEVGVGSVLVIPFGRRRVKGVVVGLAETSEVPDDRLAEPLEALDAGVPPELVELGRWTGEEYCSTPARGLQLALPPGIGTGADVRRVRPLTELEVEATADGDEALTGGARLGVRQKAILRALAAGSRSAGELGAIAGADRAAIRRLSDRGLVRTEEIERRRRPPRTEVGAVNENVRLNDAQRAAVGSITAALADGGALRRVERRRRRRGGLGDRRERTRAGDDLNQVGRGEHAQDGGPDAGARRLGRRQLAAGGDERMIRPRLRRGPALERAQLRGVEAAPETHDALVRRGRQMRRHDRREHVRERGQVVARRPAREVEQFGREEGVGGIEHLEDGPRLAIRRRRGERGDDSRPHLTPERDAHAHAGLHAGAEGGGHLVGQQVVQGHRRQGRHLDQTRHALS